MTIPIMNAEKIEGELVRIKRALEQLELALDRLNAALVPALESAPVAAPPIKLLDYMGLGKEIWRQIDVDAYINTERESWS